MRQNKIAVTGKQTDSKKKLYKNRIAEKGNGSDGISVGEVRLKKGKSLHGAKTNIICSASR